MFSTPVTSVHVRDENRHQSVREREEGYGGKGSGEKASFKTRMKDRVRHANHRFRSRAWQWRIALWGGQTDKERKEIEEVCSIGEVPVPYTEKSV